MAGGDAVKMDVRWTIWGPVLGADYKGRLRAYAWTAHSAERLASSLLPLESARSIEEALEAANGLGTPAQNMIVADRSGRIGWTIYGTLPRRIGLERPAAGIVGRRLARLERLAGRRRSTRGSSTRRAAGCGPPTPASWTAACSPLLGDGNYDVGARAREIRDRLREREQFTARDMLDIQLDARSTFLSRWRDLILRHLDPDTVAGDAARGRFREIVEKDWTGEASPDSAAYLLTRMFRDQVMERVTSFVLADCYEADPTFDYTWIRRREGAIWKLVTERPTHLLNPRYGSWSDLLTASIDALIQDAMENNSGDLARRKWSDYNVIRFRHPLSGSLPFVSRWLDMPDDEAARRRLHAAGALEHQRRVGAHGGVARQRARGHHAHAHRPERPPAVAVLRQLARRVGARRADAVHARPDPLHADAGTVRKGFGLRASGLGHVDPGLPTRNLLAYPPTCPTAPHVEAGQHADPRARLRRHDGHVHRHVEIAGAERHPAGEGQRDADRRDVGADAELRPFAGAQAHQPAHARAAPRPGRAPRAGPPIRSPPPRRSRGV